jgi:hypothetical protein
MQATSAEQLPFPAGVLQERLAGGSAGELEAMQEALEARARALISALVSQAAPEAEYPGLPNPHTSLCEACPAWFCPKMPHHCGLVEYRGPATMSCSSIAPPSLTVAVADASASL